MSDDDDPDESGGQRRPPRNPAAFLTVLAFAAIYLIWGSTYLAIRVGVRTLPPFLMAGCRFSVAGLVLYLGLRARGVPAPARHQWARAAAAGLLMLTAGNGLVTWAEQRVPSNLAALLIAVVPLYVALLDWLRPGGARPRRRVLAGIAVGASGMVLLVAGGAPAAHGATVVGVLALLLSGLAWAAGSLYARYGAMHPHPLMASAQQMIAGGAALLLVAAARGEGAALSWSAITGPSAAAFGYLTLFGSLVAFSAFGWLIKVSTPARLSTTAYVNPVIAVILGWAVLGESLTPRALAGALMIVCAVVVMAVGIPPLLRFRRG